MGCRASCTFSGHWFSGFLRQNACLHTPHPPHTANLPTSWWSCQSFFFIFSSFYQHTYQVPDKIKKNNKKLEVRWIRKTTKWPGLDPIVLTPSKKKFKHNLSFPFILLLLLRLLFETLFQSIFFKLQDGGYYCRIIKFSVIGKIGNYLGQSLSL